MWRTWSTNTCLGSGWGSGQYSSELCRGWSERHCPLSGTLRCCSAVLPSAYSSQLSAGVPIDCTQSGPSARHRHGSTRIGSRRQAHLRRPMMGMRSLEPMKQHRKGRKRNPGGWDWCAVLVPPPVSMDSWASHRDLLQMTFQRHRKGIHLRPLTGELTPSSGRSSADTELLKTYNNRKSAR